MHITRDVVFHENIQFFGGECSLKGKKASNMEEENLNEYKEERNLQGETLNIPNNKNEEGDDNGTHMEETIDDQDDKTSPPVTTTESPHESCSVTTNLNDSVLQDTPNNDIPSEHEPRYPVRHNRRVPVKRYQPDLKVKEKYPINNYVSSHRLAKSQALLVDQLSSVSIPNNVQEALKDQKWKKAMNDEIEALQKNRTWELVNLPPGKKIVGCRWIITVKLNSKGNIERYKARLVAK